MEIRREEEIETVEEGASVRYLFEAPIESSLDLRSHSDPI